MQSDRLGIFNRKDFEKIGTLHYTTSIWYAMVWYGMLRYNNRSNRIIIASYQQIKIKKIIN